MKPVAWRLAPAMLACAATASAAPPPSDPVALDRAVEEAAETELGAPVREGRNSAAVVVFVRDGAVRVARAWGFEDVERRSRTDYERSKFEIASISKVFTAVTLAALRERGLIRTWADPANAYLKSWRLPDSFGTPVTLDQLATHNAGIDEAVFGILSPTPLATPAGTDELARRMPGFFAPPGTVVAYSSFVVDVLGQVIADVTGEPYTKAVDDYVLRPLGMESTYAGYPDGWTEHAVVPYQPWRPVVAAPMYRVPSSYPSTGFVTTGKDMERLLLALLDREGRQLVVTTAMQDDLFRVHQADGDYGAAHGLLFDLVRFGGRTVLQHGGMAKSTGCHVALSPAARAGLFYCCTDPEPARGTPANVWPRDRAAVQAAMSAPLGISYGSAPVDTAATAVPWNDAWNQYLGAYLSTYRGHHGVLRLRAVLHPHRLRVARGAHGLRVGDQDGLGEIAPGVFGAPGVENTIVFHRDARTGRMMLSRATGFSMYERPPLADDPGLFRPVFAAALALAASGLAFALPRWKAGVPRPARGAAVGFAALMLGGTGILYGFHAFGDAYSLGIGWPILAVRALGFFTVPAAALLSLAAWRLRGTARGLTLLSRLSRLHLVALAVAAWVTIALLVNFGLIAFSPLR